MAPITLTSEGFLSSLDYTENALFHFPIFTSRSCWIAILQGFALNTEISYLKAILLEILAVSAYTAFLLQLTIGQPYRAKYIFVLLLWARAGVIGWTART